MSLLPKTRNPSRRDLAVFGCLWLLVLGAAGGLVLARGGNLRWTVLLWAIAVAVPALGCVLPASLRWVYRGMLYAAFPLGWVVSHASLALLYYLVVTPIGLATRLAGYDAMGKRRDPNAQTYWTARQDAEDPASYFRQF